MIKLSQIIEISDKHDQAKWMNPNNMEIHFGCDCGCGGDSYTTESWDESVKESEELLNEVKLFCEDNNIEFDL